MRRNIEALEGSNVSIVYLNGKKELSELLHR